MEGDGAPTAAPTAVRRLESEGAARLAVLAGVFDDLQMVLRCCERLVDELAADEPDPILVEAVWTTALLSWARCFSGEEGDHRLVPADLREAQPTGGMGLSRQLKDEITNCPPIVVAVRRKDDRWLATWSQADAVLVHPLDPLAAAETVAEVLRGSAVPVVKG